MPDPRDEYVAAELRRQEATRRWAHRGMVTGGVVMLGGLLYGLLRYEGSGGQIDRGAFVLSGFGLLLLMLGAAGRSA